RDESRGVGVIALRVADAPAAASEWKDLPCRSPLRGLRRHERHSGFPPVTGRTAPETYEDSREARYTYAPASSAGCPARPSGVSEPNFSTFSSPQPVAGMSGVQIGPGATAFTRMPFLPASVASAFTNAT